MEHVKVTIPESPTESREIEQDAHLIQEIHRLAASLSPAGRAWLAQRRSLSIMGMDFLSSAIPLGTVGVASPFLAPAPTRMRACRVKGCTRTNRGPRYDYFCIVHGKLLPRQKRAIKASIELARCSVAGCKELEDPRSGDDHLCPTHRKGPR